MTPRPHESEFHLFTALVTAELNDLSPEEKVDVFRLSGPVTEEQLATLVGVAIVWTANAVRAAAGVAEREPAALWAVMLERDREKRREANGTDQTAG